jgi:hypothetical protein
MGADRSDCGPGLGDYHPASTGVTMRVSVAAFSADRISHSAVVLAGVLGGILVFFVAVPLALSSPFPAPRESNWALDQPSRHIAAPITFPPELEQEDEVADWMELWTFVALPPSRAAAGFQPGEFGEPRSTGSITRAPPRAAAVAPANPFTAQGGQHNEPVRTVAAAERSTPTTSEVDDYLWEVYQRAPVKRDSSGDFSWKDPAAAKRFGLSLPLYVITGMDPDFREQLYHAGHAMDAAGIRWSILSGFRDDYRQTIASGLKAGASNSLHGGKARTGGYGHGQAADITSADGNASEVWRWIDAHGGKYGLHRPMPDDDPAHVQPKGSWHKLAVSLRESRARSSQEARAVGAASPQ